MRTPDSRPRPSLLCGAAAVILCFMGCAQSSWRQLSIPANDSPWNSVPASGPDAGTESLETVHADTNQAEAVEEDPAVTLAFSRLEEERRAMQAVLNGPAANSNGTHKQAVESASVVNTEVAGWTSQQRIESCWQQ